MSLHPRVTFRYPHQKNRTAKLFRKSHTLINGTFGLIILHQLRLTAHRLTRLKLFLKRATYHVDKTKRVVWFFCFPHLPLTRKTAGLRMGKGNGKFKSWFTNVKCNSVLLEFENFRRGRARYFSKQVAYKLGTPINELTAPVIYFGATRHHLIQTVASQFHN